MSTVANSNLNTSGEAYASPATDPIDDLVLQLRCPVIDAKRASAICSRISHIEDLKSALKIIREYPHLSPGRHIMTLLLGKECSIEDKGRLFQALPEDERVPLHYFQYLKTKGLPIATACEIFDEAIRRHIADEYIYSAFIDSSSFATDEEFDASFKPRLQGITSTPRQEICISYIRAIAKRATGMDKRWEEAKQMFASACDKKRADAPVIEVFIVAAGSVGDFTAANDAFKKALEKNIENREIYQKFVDAAEKTGHTEEAQRARFQAMRKGLLLSASPPPNAVRV